MQPTTTSHFFNNPDGFAVINLNEDQAEDIFTDNVKRELENERFTPYYPPELKVKKKKKKV